MIYQEATFTPYLPLLKLATCCSEDTFYNFRCSCNRIFLFHSRLGKLDSLLNVVGIQLLGQKKQFDKIYTLDLRILIEDLINCLPCFYIHPNANLLVHGMRTGVFLLILYMGCDYNRCPC